MYDTIKSLLTILLICTLAQAQERNVLVEYFTDVECSACPRGGVEIKRLMKKFPGRVIPLTYHFNDAMTTPLHKEYMKYEKIMGMPSFDCNRRGKFYVPTRPATGLIEDSLHIKAVNRAAITMDFSLNNAKNRLEGKVSISLLDETELDSLYLQIFFVEDSVNGGEGYAQKNIYAGSSTGEWPTLEAMDDVIADYPHRWVVRDHLLGDGLLGREIELDGSTYSKEITYTIAKTYNDLEPVFSRLSLVAVLSREPGEVLQVISQSLNDLDVPIVKSVATSSGTSFPLEKNVLQTSKEIEALSILSLNGREVLHLSPNQKRVDLISLELPHGVYILEVLAGADKQLVRWCNY